MPGSLTVLVRLEREARVVCVDCFHRFWSVYRRVCGRERPIPSINRRVSGNASSVNQQWIKNELSARTTCSTYSYGPKRRRYSIDEIKAFTISLRWMRLVATSGSRMSSPGRLNASSLRSQKSNPA